MSEQRRVLYWVNGSMWSWQAMLVLHEKQLPFESERLRVMGRRDTREPEFLALNPRGDAPVLVEPDGLIVPESMAIAHFLERRYPEVPLVPHDPAALAKVLVRAYEVDRLRRAYRPIEQLFKAPDMWTYSRQTIAQAPAAVRTELAIWQSYLSAEPYLGGEAFSLADCVGYPVLGYQRRRGPTFRSFRASSTI